MALKRTEAIVLKTQRQGETSKILTLYTRGFGKLKVIAKGARSTRSRFGGALEPLNHISIVFYDKETRDLQFLSQADIIKTFPAIQKDLEKTAIAMAVCELVNQLEIGTAPSPRLFRLLLDVLASVDRTSGKPHNCFRGFQVRLFDIMGFKPNLTVCSRCGRATPNGGRFNVSHGGYTCEVCTTPNTAGVPVSAEALGLLRAFQRSPVPRLDALAASVEAYRQVDRLLVTYWRYHVEGFKDLKALKFLSQILETC